MVCLKTSASTLKTSDAENGLLNTFVTPGKDAYSSSSLVSQSDLNDKGAGVSLGNPNKPGQSGNCGALMIDAQDDGSSFGEYRNESEYVLVHGITVQV